MKNKKGFTLIELLAVIVILGLLMAIAIPSVTKYITESRKKTVVSTIGNYITAMVNEVNDLTYTFTEANTIYAVPIECIALERGGTNPFGEWHQANNAYWAYVLVQYDDETSSYRYGYTFKDSAGYGLYPTSQSKLNEQGKQIQTNLNITRPTTGILSKVMNMSIWEQSGFYINQTTKIYVLRASAEGSTGNGKETCTLVQKGSNNDQKDKEYVEKLRILIDNHNYVITTAPTLTTSSQVSKDESGLYLSSETNTGEPTYYFRGAVNNNYVEFAGQTWRIIRINEDGSIRIMLNTRVNKQYYAFNKTNDFYYSDASNAKIILDKWYEENLKRFEKYITNGNFCEQFKVKESRTYSDNGLTIPVYTKYLPTFICSIDGNSKGEFNSKIGLITYDEVVYAGAHPVTKNNNHYLSKGVYIWTMSPAGIYNDKARVWYIVTSGELAGVESNSNLGLFPVINLKSDVLATGTGTSSDPYIIQTN